MPADIDRNRKPSFSDRANRPAENMETDPFSAFFAARNLSYEELTARRKIQQELVHKEAEETSALMTDAMRRANIDTLISVANFEISSMPITPDQAIVVLHKLLARPDHTAVKAFYPDLEEAVERRWKELRAKLLPVLSGI